MKNLAETAVVFLSFLMGSVANAAITPAISSVTEPVNITIVSDGNDLTNVGKAQCITPNPPPTWASPFPNGCWESPWNSGVGGVVLPNTTLDNPTFVMMQSVYLRVGDISAIWSFYADDSATAYIINQADPVTHIVATANADEIDHCVSVNGCETGKGESLDVSQFLAPGWNYFFLGVVQEFGAQTGVTDQIKITVTPTTPQPENTPEPPSSLMMGSGLSLAALFSRRIFRRFTS